MPEPTDSPKFDDRAEKSGGAFRTISEVSEELGVPQHVLRFWETRFTQIKPLKRGGGRRYYRPDDVALLKRIQSLLYTDGLTIKGVQKLLRDGASDTVHETEVPPAATPAVDGIGLDRTDLERVLAELTALRDDLRAALAVAK
ncbi:MAG: MerR family transcriptional regulator [Rhodospirillaceae bacterium]|nr:MerR family transcriptional regulator [Rhodospirillaceae bacterium]